jgi:hypothetical protein
LGKVWIGYAIADMARAVSTAMLALSAAASSIPSALAADVKLDGYAEWREGESLVDGSVSARHLDVRPNEVALFENMIRDATDEAEARYRKFGQIFEESGRLWDRFADKYGRGNAVVNFFF